jgi:hypothetical protein
MCREEMAEAAFRATRSGGKDLEPHCMVGNDGEGAVMNSDFARKKPQDCEFAKTNTEGGSNLPARTKKTIKKHGHGIPPFSPRISRRPDF